MTLMSVIARVKRRLRTESIPAVATEVDWQELDRWSKQQDEIRETERLEEEQERLDLEHREFLQWETACEERSARLHAEQGHCGGWCGAPWCCDAAAGLTFIDLGDSEQQRVIADSRSNRTSDRGLEL